MKYFKTYILPVLFVNCLLYFSGCLEAPVSPFGAVGGKIYDRFGFPEPDVEVSAGHYPYLFSDNSGRFTFSYVVKPYDLEIGSRMYEYLWAEKYLNLQTDVSQLIDFKYGNSASRPVNLIVTFPALDSNRYAFLKFISNEQFIQGNYYAHPHDTILYSNVEIPYDKTQISGKVLYLEFTENGYYNHIESYEKFGIKDVTLLSGHNNQIEFAPGDINYKPQLSHVTYNVVVHGNQQNLHQTSYLTFDGMNHGSDLQLESIIGTFSGSFGMPVLPQLNYKLKISSIDYSNYTDISWALANPSENVTITLDKPISLVLPADGSTGISDTSVFMISDDEEKGVYCLSFYSGYEVSPQSETHLITDRKKVTLSDIKSVYPTFVRGGRYFWNAVKYSHYNSINDFAAVKYLDDVNYTSTNSTSERVFRIAR